MEKHFSLRRLASVHGQVSQPLNEIGDPQVFLASQPFPHCQRFLAKVFNIRLPSLLGENTDHVANGGSDCPVIMP
jgi:hypothetical protein